jgi:Protein of unknown function (DUF664)
MSQPVSSPLLDEYRALLYDALDGLAEEEARLRLVPSMTTLLGLVKHVTYVEGVWFDQARGVTCKSLSHPCCRPCTSSTTSITAPTG